MHISGRLIGFIICTFATLWAHGSVHKLSTDYDKNLEAFTPKSFAKFKKRKRCPTDFQNTSLKSSPHYRALLFEALKNCKHPRPEIVILVNDSTNDAACAHKNDQYGVYVNFFEKSEHAQQSYGTKRLIMHHEAAHIVKKHYTRMHTKREQQDNERMADRIAICCSKCSQCTREYTEFWLNESWQISKSLITLRNLDALPTEKINRLINELSKNSRKLQQLTHPLPLERAMRAYRSSTVLKSLCHYHQKKSTMNFLSLLGY